MAVTPKLEDLENRLKALEQKVEDARNAAPTSIIVKDRNTGNNIIETGYDAANSNRPFFKLRDAKNNVILANDTHALGYGSVINQNTTVYPVTSVYSTTSSTYDMIWTGVLQINTQRLAYQTLVWMPIGSGSTFQGRITWSNAYGGVDGVIAETGVVSAATFMSGAYSWPTAAPVFGQAVWLTLWARRVTGTAQIATDPYGFIQTPAL